MHDVGELQKSARMGIHNPSFRELLVPIYYFCTNILLSPNFLGIFYLNKSILYFSILNSTFVI